MRILALTYTPIIIDSNIYEEAIQHYSETKPFHDGSIRPTPSFDKELQGISSMCRKDKLVNQVAKGDILLYFTNVRNYECEKYNGFDESHSRLTAILKVEKVFKEKYTDSKHPHQEADEYYTSKGITSPNNCLMGEDIAPRKKRCGIIGSKQTYESTRKGYNKRVEECKTYVVTRFIYSNFTTPVPLFKTDFERIWNKKLKKRTPFNQVYIKLTNFQYEGILEHLRSFGERV